MSSADVQILDGPLRGDVIRFDTIYLDVPCVGYHPQHDDAIGESDVAEQHFHTYGRSGLELKVSYPIIVAADDGEESFEGSIVIERSAI